MLIKMEIKPRQLEIIEVAGKLLTRSGINGLTIKNLAYEMNFSEGAIYRHFKNKEEIILTLLRYLHENVREILRKAPEEDDFEEALTSLFVKLARYFKENPYYVVAVFSEGLMDESARVSEKIMVLIGTLMTHVQLIVQEGQKRNQIVNSIDAKQIAHIITPSFRHQMFRWKMSNFTTDIERDMASLAEAFGKLLQVDRERELNHFGGGDRYE